MTQPAQDTVVMQELTTGEPVERPQPVGQDAHLPLRPRRVGREVDARDLDSPLVGPEQPRDHRERRGLARAVGADDP
jgi:hypothetical protein